MQADVSITSEPVIPPGSAQPAGRRFATSSAQQLGAFTGAAPGPASASRAWVGEALRAGDVAALAGILRQAGTAQAVNRELIGAICDRLAQFFIPPPQQHEVQTNLLPVLTRAAQRLPGLSATAKLSLEQQVAASQSGTVMAIRETAADCRSLGADAPAVLRTLCIRLQSIAPTPDNLDFVRTTLRAEMKKSVAALPACCGTITPALLQHIDAAVAAAARNRATLMKTAAEQAGTVFALEDVGSRCQPLREAGIPVIEALCARLASMTPRAGNIGFLRQALATRLQAAIEDLPASCESEKPRLLALAQGSVAQAENNAEQSVLRQMNHLTQITKLDTLNTAIQDIHHLGTYNEMLIEIACSRLQTMTLHPDDLATLPGTGQCLNSAIEAPIKGARQADAQEYSSRQAEMKILAQDSLQTARQNVFDTTLQRAEEALSLQALGEIAEQCPVLEAAAQPTQPILEALCRRLATTVSRPGQPQELRQSVVPKIQRAIQDLPAACNASKPYLQQSLRRAADVSERISRQRDLVLVARMNIPPEGLL